jgi:putative transposase
MPRTARIVLPGIPHHVTHVGKNHQQIFIDDQDRISYLEILKNRCNEIPIEIHGYCLMPNHIHLVATPPEKNSLTSVVGYTHRIYSKQYNERYDKKHSRLWQSRFYSCPLDEAHFLQALIYVDRNPVRAGFVDLPWNYKWSSARAHIEGIDPMELIDMQSWERIASEYDYQTVLKQKMDGYIISSIEEHTISGKPLGKF